MSVIAKFIEFPWFSLTVFDRLSDLLKGFGARAVEDLHGAVQTTISQNILMKAKTIICGVRTYLASKSSFIAKFSKPLSPKGVENIFSGVGDLELPKMAISFLFSAPVRTSN